MICLYLEASRFAIRTDHDSFKWNLNLPDGTSRLARWCLLLLDFKLEVSYWAGFKHRAMHALSQIQTTGTDTDRIEDKVPVAVIDTDTTESTKVRLDKPSPGVSSSRFEITNFYRSGTSYHCLFFAASGDQSLL